MQQIVCAWLGLLTLEVGRGLDRLPRVGASSVTALAWSGVGVGGA